jgi:hypothetical protein
MSDIQRTHLKPVKKKTVVIERPFWLSASNYYTFAAAVTISLFFLVWGILNEANETAPWIGAGVLAGIVLAGAVVLREVILRSHRNRRLSEQARLEETLRSVAAFSNLNDRRKLSLKQHEAWLAHIGQRSEAAKVLDRISAAHRDVFDLCEQYLGDIDDELGRVAPGSPRIGAFKAGVRHIKKLHRFHLLRWAELETTQLRLGGSGSIADTLHSNDRAEEVLGFALSYYPNESDLTASMAVVSDAKTMITAAELTDNAEKERDLGNPEAALELYRDALAVLTNNALEVDDSRARIIESISAKIEMLRLEIDIDQNM